MPKQKQPFNPFYALLLVVGVAFTITACAYALMMLRATMPGRADSPGSVSLLNNEAGLMRLLDKHGMEILGIEVLLLALTTVGAIGLDQYRMDHELISPRKVTVSAREVSPRRGQTLVAGSAAPGSIRQDPADPEGVKPTHGSTPSGSSRNV